MSADDLLASAVVIGDVSAVVQSVPSASADDLRQLIDVLRRKQPAKLAVFLATVVDDKVQLVAGFTPDLVETGLHAGNWLKEVAPVVGGGGGGRPDLAQAGGKIPAQVPEALRKAVEVVRSRLSE